MVHKSAVLILVSLAMTMCSSCKKQNEGDAGSASNFNPKIDGVAVVPMARIDSELAAQIRNNKQAILEGESIVPAIGADYQPAAPASVSRPAAPRPTGPTEPERSSSPQPQRTAPAATNTFSFDPNGY